MSNRKDHEFKENLERCYNIVQQSSTKGISAVEVAEKLGKHRTTVHGYLNTLEYTGRVESQHGTWHAKTGEQTIKPLEKEILIELPIPKNQWQKMAQLEIYANYVEGLGFLETAKIPRTILEKFNETRTIRITGKNVDDLDLEKLGNLIQQANEKSSKVNLRGLFKGLKRSRPDSKHAPS
jgi:biotin operon repressor